MAVLPGRKVRLTAELNVLGPSDDTPRTRAGAPFHRRGLAPTQDTKERWGMIPKTLSALPSSVSSVKNLSFARMANKSSRGAALMTAPLYHLGHKGTPRNNSP